MSIKINIFLISLIFPLLTYSQEDKINLGDQATLDSLGREAELIVTDTAVDRPNIAAIYSAVLPGLGQVYNNKAWKIPIIYGGFVLFGYIINYNNNAYVEYREALYAVQDGDIRTNPKPPYNAASLDLLKRGTEAFRRNRDLTIIATIAWYLLNVVDAHVDAHLNEFTINEDLSLNLRPQIETNNYLSKSYGVSLVLNF